MAQNSAADQQYPVKTHLFTVRLWQAETDPGKRGIRGKVQHVLSGEVRYFSDWCALQAFLVKLAAETDNSASD